MSAESRLIEFWPDGLKAATEDHRQRVARAVIDQAADIAKIRIEAWEDGMASIRANGATPIKELLAAHLLLLDDGYERIEFRSAANPFDKSAHWFGSAVRFQAPHGPYRADFSFLSSCEGYRRAMIVECDGHDFHERTKEQAAHDKARDRWFQSQGFVVLRFTGSEIYRDPEKCAEEVGSALNQRIEECMVDAGVIQRRARAGA